MVAAKGITAVESIKYFMRRRDFIRATGLSAALAPVLSYPYPTRADVTPAVGTVHEPARDIPIAGKADVIICGAGPAGVAAAIAAARKGGRTLLMEAHGCLGGIWTSGLLSWVLDYQNKKGFMSELLEQVGKKDGRAFSTKGAGTSACDPEVMKVVLEELCEQAGVQIQYHTRVCAAVKDANARLTHVITESKSGREALAGKVFVDCTGDGDLAARAGCGFDYGSVPDGRAQPMSLIMLVTGVQAQEILSFYRDPDTDKDSASKSRLRSELERAGCPPSYGTPSLHRVRDDLFIMMSNHEYEVKGMDARDVTRATLHARRELHAQVNGLRSLGGPWKNLRLVASAEQIGVREGRRIHGLYTLTVDDLKEGRKQPDAVCQARFGIDVHATNPRKEKGIENSGIKAKPYDIPLRSLIAKDAKGLMMAGRCISGDFLAHSSYRVTGDAVAMGEAAGKVAALAAKTNRLPQEVKIDEIGLK
jgi:hypothetical protein